ncbi:MAG: hypothetical protein LBU65_14655 [Planctomycetaceae bacterium]|nr:hypothetical protein [Planctomycetaceae bacterium]
MSTPSPPKKEFQGLIPIFFECLFGRWTAGGVACGVAFGAMLGLIPPGNLVSLVTFLLLFFTGGNLIFAAFTVILFIFVSRVTAPFADQLGEKILTNHSVEQIASRALEYPLAAWTDLDNTVVLGQTLFAVIIFVPLLLVVWGILRIGRRSTNVIETQTGNKVGL